MKAYKMRKPGICGLLVMAAFVVALMGCGSQASGDPDNFRGIKWGADFSSLSGFNQIAQEGALSFYEKTDDALQMDDVKVDQIIYGFYKGRFYTAMIYFPSSSFARMKDIVVKQFGQPAEPDKTPSKLVWDGTSVTVLLAQANTPESSRLAYIYKPIQLEVEMKK